MMIIDSAPVTAGAVQQEEFNLTWIQTASGLKFPLLDIDPSAILIEDIAHDAASTPTEV